MKKLTKWGAGLVAAIAMMFMAGQAGAIELGVYEVGVLVPIAVHNGSNVDTVVGLTALQDNTVYWTFFDNNSTHVTDGEFDVTANDLHGFSWMAESGMGLEDMDGYLVFTINNADILTGAANATLGANAFMVDTATDDAIFVPCVPLDIDDYAWPLDLTVMDANSIWSLWYGTWEGLTVDIRYWIDPAYSASTQIVIWTVEDVEGTYTVNMFNDEEERKSLNFELENEELSVIDPSTLLGVPADFIDGFIRWTFPDVTLGPDDDGIAFSYIDSTAFGAKQTLLAQEDWEGWATP